MIYAMTLRDSNAAAGREARRSRIKDASMRMAAEGGYEAVQMRAVAERADVSLGTIYRYFNGKDDMLLAGLVSWIQRVREGLESRPGEPGTATERLSALLAGAAQSAERAPMLMSALVTAGNTTDPAAADYKLAAESELRQLVVAAIGDDPNIDAAGVARVIGHVWFSASNRWVGGLAAAGSVEEELRHAVRMLTGSEVSA